MQEEYKEPNWNEPELTPTNDNIDADNVGTIESKDAGEEIESEQPQRRSKKTIIKMIIGVFVFLIVTSFFIYTSTKTTNKENQQTNIAEVRKSFDQALGELELKVVNIKNNEIAQTQTIMQKLQSKVETQTLQLKKLKVTIDQQSKIVTDLSSTEKFNQQLVDLLSKENDKNKIEIVNLRTNLEALTKHVALNTGKATNKPIDRPNPITTLELVNGFNLFNIDLWGDEKIAVFIKGNKIQKVKNGEKIEGYLITDISMNNAFVSLYKNNQKYAIKVK
jgi:hypothetical protein